MADPTALDGWAADGAHHYLLRVQFEDTDAGGIVYHANYLALLSARALPICVVSTSARKSRWRQVPRWRDDVCGARLTVDYRRRRTRRRLARGDKAGGDARRLDDARQDVVDFEHGHILARLLVDIGAVAARMAARGHGGCPATWPTDCGPPPPTPFQAERRAVCPGPVSRTGTGGLGFMNGIC